MNIEYKQDHTLFPTLFLNESLLILHPKYVQLNLNKQKI